VIEATRLAEGGRVYIEKECPEHGKFRSLVWSDSQLYADSFRYGMPGKKHLIKSYAIANPDACPTDCGLCSEHEQHTCFAVLELTNRCNLSCPVCYASANSSEVREPSLAKIEEMLRFILDCEVQPPTLQLTGGEPTIRKDLPQIVGLARRLGFVDITLSTNGILLANDPDLARKLADAGLVEVSLQFDGVDDDVYTRIRGVPLFSKKLIAIENARKAGLNVSVAATLVPGVNVDHIGEIIQFAREHQLDGVNFSPIACVGRYPDFSFNPENRLTIPDVLREIEKQTGGELLGSDFVPVPCPDTRCSTMTYVFNTPDGLVPLTRVCDVGGLLDSLLYGERVVQGERVRSALDKLWSMSAIPGSEKVLSSVRECAGDKLAQSGRCMSIGIHGFQDAWNLDLERVRKCCIHIATQEKKLIPFCVYNNIVRP
jgi:hypothetical protein